MNKLAFDNWQKSRAIWGARVILFYLLAVQVRHQMQDFGGYGMDSFLYAVAMEVSISVGLSGIVTILLTGQHWARFLILIFIPVLFIGAQNSVDASMRVFAKNKVDQIEHERLGVEGQLSRNNLIMAGNALNALREQGITSGLAYNNAQRDYQAARAEMQTSKQRGSESTSEKALNLTEGDDAGTDEKVLEIAERRAWLLLGFVLLFSAVSGLWTMLTSDINWQSFTGGSRSKKPRGSSQPKPKKTVELVDFAGDESTPIKKKTTPTPATNKASRPSVGADSENQKRAQRLADEIQSGQFIRANGKPVTDKLSYSDIAQVTSSKQSQGVIMDHLEEMGVVEKQGGKRAALITEDYQPQTDSDEVYEALKGWGGIKPAVARSLANQATGDTTEDRIKSALKLHKSVA